MRARKMDYRDVYLWCLGPLVLLLTDGVHADVKLLSCHSVNVIPRERPTEYVFIATKKEDCTFVFEGPEDTKLDMEVRSVSFPKRYTDPENCRKSKLTIYNYIDSRVILGKLVCNENEKANLLTKSNMGIVTSSLTDGSFSIKIRPKVEDHPRGEMVPPRQTAEDFFFTGSSEGFKPSPGVFKPSLPLHQAKPFQPSGFYPGRPTAVVDITYNATGHNFTIITHKPTTPPVGAEETTVFHPTAKPSGDVSSASSSLPTNGAKPSTQGKPTTAAVVAQASVTTSTEHLEEE